MLIKKKIEEKKLGDDIFTRFTKYEQAQKKEKAKIESVINPPKGSETLDGRSKRVSKARPYYARPI